MTPVPVGPLELLDVDHLLSDEERAVQVSAIMKFPRSEGFSIT